MDLVPRKAHHRADTGRLYGGIPQHAAAGLHDYVVAALSEQLPLGSRVLDVGSGSGALAARLIDAGFDVVASDVEIQDYRAAAPIIEWDASSAEIPHRRESFDAICAVEVLEHVENPMQALRNFHALLRHDGVLIVTTPHIGHPKSRIKFLLRGAPSYFGTREYYSNGHRTLLPDWLLRRHLEETRFSLVAVSYAGRMGLRGWARLGWRILSPFVGMLHSKPRTDDGCITVAIGRKSTSGGGIQRDASVPR